MIAQTVIANPQRLDKERPRKLEHLVVWPRRGEPYQPLHFLCPNHQHHATMIVCSDRDEVAEWDLRLKNLFGQNVEHSTIAAFVRWVRAEGKTHLAIVVWDGPAKSVEGYYIYAHELAHIVDRDPSGRRISDSDQWKTAWESEKTEILRAVYESDLRNAISQSSGEAFATLLALYGITPRVFLTRKQTIRRFLEERELVRPEVETFQG
ncbi:hypothetical protein [Thermogutta sp.]|uniref:hypothetical protein n=1 Tax=Thermogutta sp. TaxID=1962930 RepID=UPI00322083A6